MSHSCYQSCKDKNFKAIHNSTHSAHSVIWVVINLAKIKILKQFTTVMWWFFRLRGCYQSCKDKNFKAIHNSNKFTINPYMVVINLAKIKILKQFTTISMLRFLFICCYQSCKDKNFKAIHNNNSVCRHQWLVVINLAKIKILKQFTTARK